MVVVSQVDLFVNGLSFSLAECRRVGLFLFEKIDLETFESDEQEALQSAIVSSVLRPRST